MYPGKTEIPGRDIIPPPVLMYSYVMNYFIGAAFPQSKVGGGERAV